MIRWEQLQNRDWQGFSGELPVASVVRDPDAEQERWSWKIEGLKRPKGWRKPFAKFEADEQKGLAEVLRSMLEPAGTASPQSVAGAAQPDQKHAVMIQNLQQAKAGDAFDKEFVKGQLDGHRELLQIQEPRTHRNA